MESFETKDERQLTMKIICVSTSNIQVRTVNASEFLTSVELTQQ